MSKLKDNLLDEYHGDDSLLYHYTTMKSACKILESNKLRLSNLLNMNDPLEFCRPKGLGFNGIDESHKDAFKDLQLSLKERENSVRLLCFCKDEFFNQEEWNNEKAQTKAANLLHKGWARNRMWAQYADNHKGVCLIFNRAEFKTEFEKMKNQSKHIKILADRKITYTNYLHELESEMTDEINTKTHDGNFRHYYLDDERLKYLFYKCEDYRDELEYRFALIDSTLKSPFEEKFIDFGKSLKAIIFGQRFSNIVRFSLPQDIEQFRIDWNCGIPMLW